MKIRTHHTFCNYNPSTWARGHTHMYTHPKRAARNKPPPHPWTELAGAGAVQAPGLAHLTPHPHENKSQDAPGKRRLYGSRPDFWGQISRKVVGLDPVHRFKSVAPSMWKLSSGNIGAQAYRLQRYLTRSWGTLLAPTLPPPAPAQNEKPPLPGTGNL